MKIRSTFLTSSSIKTEFRTDRQKNWRLPPKKLETEKLKSDELRSAVLCGIKPGRVRGKGAAPVIQMFAEMRVNDENQVIETNSPGENIMIVIPAPEDQGDVRAPVPALVANHSGGNKRRAPHEQAVLDKMLTLAKAALFTTPDPAFTFYRKYLSVNRL